MKLLITGACGFVGCCLARSIREAGYDWTLFGIDNLSRRGSERNLVELSTLGVNFKHADLRSQSDVDALPAVDWVLDAAANPSVLAGVDGNSGTRQVMENNLLGTINLLEKCRRETSGFILLSTSRVYSIAAMANLPVHVTENHFTLDATQRLPVGVSESGISESFSTCAPISLYGASKLVSETLAVEYGDLGNFPVWVNRCGVMAGAGQFGRPDQGIFAFWINSHLRRKPLSYFGFGGMGYQVRDCLHPRDLIPLIDRQTATSHQGTQPKIVNVSGGLASSMSLRQLTEWCDDRFGAHHIDSVPEDRVYDIPWLVLDHESAARVWEWQPMTPVKQVLEEIATHALANADWLRLSN